MTHLSLIRRLLYHYKMLFFKYPDIKTVYTKSLSYEQNRTMISGISRNSAEFHGIRIPSVIFRSLPRNSEQNATHNSGRNTGTGTTLYRNRHGHGYGHGHRARVCAGARAWGWAWAWAFGHGNGHGHGYMYMDITCISTCTVHLDMERYRP
jgi:hypothetical protein